MRRHTSNPVDRSSTPRSPAGIDTSRMHKIRAVLEAGRERARPVGRGDGAEAEHVQLVEQQLDVRRHVVGDEDQRCIRGQRVGFHGQRHGRTLIPMLMVQACSDAPTLPRRTRSRESSARSVEHVPARERRSEAAGDALFRHGLPRRLERAAFDRGTRRATNTIRSPIFGPAMSAPMLVSHASTPTSPGVPSGRATTSRRATCEPTIVEFAMPVYASDAPIPVRHACRGRAPCPPRACATDRPARTDADATTELRDELEPGRQRAAAETENARLR